MDRPYRVPLRLSDLSDDGGLCKADVDFGRWLRTAGVEGLIDPRSIMLAMQNAQSGEIEQIPCRVSEMLFYQDHGEIHWTTDRVHRDAQWWLYFDVVGDKRYTPPYAANVGFGDELMLNCDCPAPIEVPLHSSPISVDWDGSNEKPFFDLPLRLRARGVEYEIRAYSKTPVADESGFISEYYLRFDLFDWFGTGRLDLITMSLSDEYIRIYRNTGVRDGNGLPVLELAQKIRQPGGVNRTGYPGIRVLDWFGDGRPTLIITHTGDALFVWHCTSSAGEEPRFEGSAQRLLLEDGDPVPGNWSFDLCDWTGEGRRDLVMEDLNLPFPCLRLYQNIGTPQKPVYRDAGRLETFRRTQFPLPRWAKDDAFHGLLMGGDDACIRYWEMTGRDKMGLPQFVDRGHLMGRAARVSSYEYSSPMACDWDGDGDWDLLIGNDMGFVYLCENVGTKERPVFKQGTPLTTVDGELLRIMREDVLHDADGERYCGQTKVVFADWDGDGLPDLILGNNTNRIFFCKNVGKPHGIEKLIQGGKPNHPEFAKPAAIEVEGVADPFGWRCRPSVVDWDGSGLPDLVSASSQHEICLFRRYRDPATGELKLSPGESLVYENGEIITPSNLRPADYNPEWGTPYAHCLFIDVCDWNGNGKWDLIVTCNWHINYLENVGDNAHPRFRLPVALATPDGPIHHISRHEIVPCAVDWNGNGQLDLLVGGESGFVYFFDRRCLEGKMGTAEVGKLEIRG
jgi:hypothetical protein